MAVNMMNKELPPTKLYFKGLVFSLVIDVVFGLIAAAFVYFVIGEIVPEILNTSLMNGALVIKVDANVLKRIFSIWHNFCILFGLRFVISYIVGAFSKK